MGILTVGLIFFAMNTFSYVRWTPKIISLEDRFREIESRTYRDNTLHKQKWVLMIRDTGFLKRKVLYLQYLYVNSLLLKPVYISKNGSRDRFYDLIIKIERLESSAKNSLKHHSLFIEKYRNKIVS